MEAHYEAVLTALMDAAIFLEFSGDTAIDPDAAVGALEQMFAKFVRLDCTGRSQLSQDLTFISQKYDGKKREFVQKIASEILSFGVTT